MKKLLCCLWLLAMPSLAAPWNSGGLPPVKMKPMPQMRILNADSPGEPLDLKAELSEGKFNVVDFYAEW